MSSELKDHWENVYHHKAVDQVSWFQPHADLSMQLINTLPLAKKAQIIDVGGGASVLVDDLLQAGFQHISVLDVAAAALGQSQQRLAERSQQVCWRVENILEAEFQPNSFDLWHDRAVFHFLTDPVDQQRYLAQVRNAVKPGGFIIIATFAEDGPLKCSGLAVQRYSIEALTQTFAAAEVELIQSVKHTHITPAGAEQKFNYCLLQRKASI